MQIPLHASFDSFNGIISEEIKSHDSKIVLNNHYYEI